MSRDLTTALETALSADVIQPFFAVDLNFDVSPLYVWSGQGDIVIDSKTYIGSEELLKVESIEEAGDASARGAVLTLTGVPSEVISIALNTEYQGRTGSIHFGTLSDSTEYTEIFTGYIDTMEILDEPNRATVRVTLESRLVRLETPSGIKYTSSHQKNQYPGDLGLDFVESLPGKKIIWGNVSE